MQIRPTATGFLAVSDNGVEVALPSIDQLREQVMLCLKFGALTGVPGHPDEEEAVAMLARCDLRYEALPSDAIGIVIVSPPELVETLGNYEHLPTQLLMTTIYDTCPELGGDRVEPIESGG